MQMYCFRPNRILEWTTFLFELVSMVHHKVYSFAFFVVIMLTIITDHDEVAVYNHDDGHNHNPHVVHVAAH